MQNSKTLIGIITYRSRLVWSFTLYLHFQHNRYELRHIIPNAASFWFDSYDMLHERAFGDMGSCERGVCWGHFPVMDHTCGCGGVPHERQMRTWRRVLAVTEIAGLIASSSGSP